MNDHEEHDEQSERPRPRVVDKRVTARAASAPAPDREESKPAPPEPPPPAAPAEAAPTGAEAGAVWTPEQEADARRMVEEIKRVSAVDWVLSSLMTLVNVASVKLESGDLQGAQLAIDAISGLIDSVGTRLGENEAPLRQVVTQLKMAYAQAATARPEPSGGSSLIT